MEDVVQFIGYYTRLQESPPNMELPLQEVWKQLQEFAKRDPLSFYELVMIVDPKMPYTPGATWHDRIVAQGLATVVKDERGKPTLEIHDLVDVLFRRYLTPPEPEITARPPRPATVHALAPVRLAKRPKKKKKIRK